MSEIATGVMENPTEIALHQRILKGIDEIDEVPVLHRWKAFQALEERDVI
ncbi:MAG: hypothetical protein P4L56_09410 [Candidatus Sulfopaludibacter sp.]|nr:hypothetical protein [Candidatus Sulfopaludibacter sp.]